MDKEYYYDIALQIFEDTTGSITYSVIQNFSEQEDDHEVIAYGETDTVEEALKAAKEAFLGVLNS